MNPANANAAASVRARLRKPANAQGVDFNQVPVRFALYRVLYRQTQSRHADRFLLNGALLFTLWYDMPHPPREHAVTRLLADGDRRAVEDHLAQCSAT